MTHAASTPHELLQMLPPERQEPMRALRETINAYIPAGFEEGMGSGMITWNVPLLTYPAGYHCSPGQPLPFVAIASQKHFIALYHMGIYARPDLLVWFTDAWPTHVKSKLDMGKSCIRFKKVDALPLDLIGLLMGKMSVDDWIETYEVAFKR